MTDNPANIPAVPEKVHSPNWGGARRRRADRGINSLKNEVLTLRARYGVMPLDYILKALNAPPPERKKDEKDEDYDRRLRNDEKRKDWAASEAAPYMHAKLASIEIHDVQDGPVKHEVDLTKLSMAELDQLEELVTKASKPHEELTLDNEQYREVK